MKSLMLLLAVGLVAPEKLDRTYLPPPGSKYSGGSPGDLQVPLEDPKKTNTTATPIILGHQITSPEDTQRVPGFQRYPGPSFQGPEGLVPVTSTNRPFNYNVPTTTTSYAFTQTTTFPPGFETTISPATQGFFFDGTQPGIVNQPFNQGQNYPQINTQGRPNLSQPGSQIPQIPGIILPNTNIPGSKTTISSSQTVTGQPDYNLVQNQYQQNIPSSTVSPNIDTQTGVPTYNQGYTQHLGVQPPHKFVHQENIATPISFSGYPSNVPLYQNTSFFQQTNPDGVSQQLSQQPLRIQGSPPILPSSNLQPGLQYVDKYGNIKPTEVPFSNFQQRVQYQEPQFGTSSTPAPCDVNIYSTPGVLTPTNLPSQPGNQNNLGLNQKPYDITGIQEIPGSTVTQQQSQGSQYDFQPGGIPSTRLPQTTTVYGTSGQTPVDAKGTISSSNIEQGHAVPGSVSVQELNQPSFGQQLQVPGTYQDLLQQQRGQLPFNGHRGYPTTTTQRPIYKPGTLQQQGQIQLNGRQGFPTSHLQPGQQIQYGNEQDIYASNIPQEIPPSGILTQQPQITSQQGFVQGLPYNLQQGPSKVGSEIDNISGVTNPAFNLQPGVFPAGELQTFTVQPVQQVQQQNLGVNNQPQFVQHGTKIPQQYTTARPASLNAQSLAGFTRSDTLGYGQMPIPTSPTSMYYSTSQGSPIPLTTPGYSNVQATMSTVTIQPRPVRPQGEADSNANILNYHNVITPKEYSYSFDTSNGIHADENGTTIEGTRANGSYSYIGHDGKLYKVDYTADENGFRPRGDHIPTPPPVPEAIQRVIEQAEKDREAGVSHDGFYDHSRYGPKRYQKHRKQHSQMQKVKDQTNINSKDLSKHNIIKNHYGSLDDFKIDDNQSDIVKGFRTMTLKPQFTKSPEQKYNDVTDDTNIETDHKQSSADAGSDTSKAISTDEDAFRRQPGSVGKIGKQGNRYKSHPQNDDYDFLTEDDFDQISSLEKDKNRRLPTSKYTDSERRKYLPDDSKYKTQGQKQTQGKRLPNTTSKYDESFNSEENIDYGEGDQQQYPERKPTVFKETQIKKHPVAIAKYDRDSYDEEEQSDGETTQPKIPANGYSRNSQIARPSTSIESAKDFEKQESPLRPNKTPFRKPQGAKRPSYTKYAEDRYDKIYEVDGKFQRPGLNTKPQGTRRPSTFTEGSESDESVNQDVRQKKPSKGLSRRPQDSRRPSITGSFEDYADGKTYLKHEQNRRPGKPRPAENFETLYPITEHSNEYNDELGIPKDSITSGRPKNPTSTSRPHYDDTRNKHTGQPQSNAVSYEKDIYEQHFGNKYEYPQEARDKETGYQYTRPQNAFDQVKNKFPSRFSEKVQEGVTKRPYKKYEITDTKTTVQPFITPNVSRNDDESSEDSSEENLPLKNVPAPQKGHTSSYDDYRTTDNGEKDLDIVDKEIAMFQPEIPGKIGSIRRPNKPEYDNESIPNNDKNLHPEDTFRPSQNGRDRYLSVNKKIMGGQRLEPKERQSTNPDVITVSPTTQASRRIFGPGTKQPSSFFGEREGESPYSTTLSPSDTTETERDIYTEVTTPTALSTHATKRPSRPGSYSGVTQPSTDTPSYKLTTPIPTTQTAYDYTNETTFPGSPNIRPGLPESVFSWPSSGRPSKPGYYPKNTPGTEFTAPVTVNQTGIPREGYYQVTGPTYKPQGENYPNSGIISAIPESRLPGRPGLPELPTTTYRPNYSMTDIARPTQVNVDAFGRPISGGVSQLGYVTPGQNVPITGNTVYQDARVIRPDLPSSIFNAGESRFGGTTSAPGPKPAEFGPSSITTPVYLGPKFEDFSGPKQRQRFDPNTGYYY